MVKWTIGLLEKRISQHELRTMDNTRASVYYWERARRIFLVINIRDAFTSLKDGIHYPAYIISISYCKMVFLGCKMLFLGCKMVFLGCKMVFLGCKMVFLGDLCFTSFNWMYRTHGKNFSVDYLDNGQCIVNHDSLCSLIYVYCFPMKRWIIS